MAHIVKRKGHKESFDERKIYASIYAACLTLRMPNNEAELIAGTATKEVLESVKEFTEVSSHTIHEHVVESLKNYNKDAAYMYESHKDIS